MSSDLIAIGLELVCSASRVKYVTDLLAELGIVVCGSSRQHNLRQERNQFFGETALLLINALQFFVAVLVKDANAFQDHLHQIITHCQLGLLEKAQQQGIRS